MENQKQTIKQKRHQKLKDKFNLEYDWRNQNDNLRLLQTSQNKTIESLISECKLFQSIKLNDTDNEDNLKMEFINWYNSIKSAENEINPITENKYKTFDEIRNQTKKNIKTQKYSLWTKPEVIHGNDGSDHMHLFPVDHNHYRRTNIITILSKEQEQTLKHKFQLAISELTGFQKIGEIDTLPSEKNNNGDLEFKLVKKMDRNFSNEHEIYIDKNNKITISNDIYFGIQNRLGNKYNKIGQMKINPQFFNAKSLKERTGKKEKLSNYTTIFKVK